MESSFYKIVVGVSMTTEVLDEMACPIMYKIGYDRAGAFYKKIDNALLGNKKSFFSSLLLPLRAFNNLARLVHQGILCTQYAQLDSMLDLCGKGCRIFYKQVEQELIKSGTYDEDWIFSEENRRVIRETMKFMRKTINPIINQLTISQIVDGISAWTIIQCVWRQRHYEPAVVQIDQEDFIIKEIDYYCDFAISAYGTSALQAKFKEQEEYEDFTDIQSVCEYLKILKSQVIFKHEENQEFLPIFYVIVNHDRKSIVLTIRGTASLFDAITDVKAKYTDFCFNGIEGKMHGGILLSAQNILELSRQTLLQATQQYPDYKLILTGHSLGAGTAAILTYLIKLDSELCDINLITYCIACPPVVSANLTEVLAGQIYCVVNQYDIVARASLGSIEDIFQIIIQIQSIKQTNPDFNAKKLGEERKHCLKEDESELCQTYDGLKQYQQSEKLYAPGNIMQIELQDESILHY